MVRHECGPPKEGEHTEYTSEGCSIIDEGEVNGGSVVEVHVVEPHGLVRRVEAVEALKVGPFCKGASPQGGGLAQEGPVLVVGVEVPSKEGWGDLVEVMGEEVVQVVAVVRLMSHVASWALSMRSTTRHEGHASG